MSAKEIQAMEHRWFIAGYLAAHDRIREDDAERGTMGALGGLTARMGDRLKCETEAESDLSRLRKRMEAF